MKKECGFVDCTNDVTVLSPGAEIGYVIDGMTRQVHACNRCANLVMMLPRGSWHITDEPRLKPIPAKPIIIT